MAPQVTILGAGIVGICTALSLAERGIPVRIIDRKEPGQETSSGNAGVISPWSIVPQALPGTWKQIPGLLFGTERALSVRAATWPDMIPWGLRFLRSGTIHQVRRISNAMEVLCGPSVDLYRRHLSGTEGEGLIRDSLYIHAFRKAEKASLNAIDYKIRRQSGAELELVGADALRRLEPALSPDFQAAIIIKGQARALSPGRICTVLADKARDKGVQFIKANIDALVSSENGWTIRCDDETYDAVTVVLSMGAWSPAVLKHLGLRVPLMAERGYHVECADSGIEIENSVMDVEAKCVASSMDTGLRFAGQAEFGPVDAPPDPRKQALLTKLARRAFPDLQTGQTHFWMGRRPSFPDSLPAIGEVGHPRGLYLNFGHSHYGLMMAPKSGEIVADQIAGRPTNADLSPYSIERFQ